MISKLLLCLNRSCPSFPLSLSSCSIPDSNLLTVAPRWKAYSIIVAPQNPALFSSPNHVSQCLQHNPPPPHRHRSALAHLRGLNAAPLRCGHVFADSEPNYNCIECGFDRTCVLCHRCFHASEHRNHKHSVAARRSSRLRQQTFGLQSSCILYSLHLPFSQLHFSAGGGCCDCGDEEAWKEHPSCTHHARNEEDSAVGSFRCGLRL